MTPAMIDVTVDSEWVRALFRDERQRRRRLTAALASLPDRWTRDAAALSPVLCALELEALLRQHQEGGHD